MARTERKELRLAPETVERIDDARGDVSFNRFVERALESALGTVSVQPHKKADARAARDLPPASSRAPRTKPSIAETWRR